jgi:hypothetical protein
VALAASSSDPRGVSLSASLRHPAADIDLQVPTHTTGSAAAERGADAGEEFASTRGFPPSSSPPASSAATDLHPGDFVLIAVVLLLALARWSVQPPSVTASPRAPLGRRALPQGGRGRAAAWGAKRGARRVAAADRATPPAHAGSGSGVDPHVSPAKAGARTGRIARSRDGAEAEVGSLVAMHAEERRLGVPRVHVLRLNLALDPMR